MKEQIIGLLKKSAHQGETPEREKVALYQSCSKPGVLYLLAKIHKALENRKP